MKAIAGNEYWAAFHAARQPGKTINLDARIPEHRTLMTCSFGDSDSDAAHYPERNQILRDTFRNHELGLGLDYRTLNQINEPTTDFVDSVDIEFIDYNPETKLLQVRAVASLVNVSQVNHRLEIFTATGEPVAGKTQSIADTTHAEIIISTEFDYTQYSSPNLEINYAAHWFDSADNILKSQLHSDNVSADMVTTTNVEDITMIDPINKHTPQGNRIIVCYRRTPDRGEVVDYIYDEKIVSSKQELYLDFGADVKIGGGKVFNTIDIGSFLLKMDCGRGGARYQVVRTPSIDKWFGKTDTGFSFQLDNDWLDSVPTSRGTLSDIVLLSFAVEFMYTDGTKDDIQISSYADVSDNPNLKMIPTLGLLWGCLVEGTLITMFDGSQSPIENIRIGDSVKTDNGCATVINTWQGHESEIIKIVTDIGELECSVTHPVKTTAGMVRALDITAEHKIIARNNEPVSVLAVERAEKFCKVFNLDLEKDNVFYANGLLVGDNGVQNSTSPRN
jgi:hypothetical protein